MAGGGSKRYMIKKTKDFQFLQQIHLFGDLFLL